MTLMPYAYGAVEFYGSLPALRVIRHVSLRKLDVGVRTEIPSPTERSKDPVELSRPNGLRVYADRTLPSLISWMYRNGRAVYSGEATSED